MENLYQDIGKRMSTLRKKKQITQEKLAEELDISTKHVSAVERGVSSLSLEKLIETSHILDCTLDYLILGVDYHGYFNKLPLTILNVLSHGDDDEINLLINYLEMYVKIRKYQKNKP